MNHPARFLTHGFPLTPIQWEELKANSTSHAPGPGPHSTTFHFPAASINDSYDRTIIADAVTNTFQCLPQPHCACHEAPLDCECTHTTCHLCGAPFIALASSCQHILCVQDDCPLCQHQRETCAADQIKRDIVEEHRQDTSQDPSGTQAQHYVAAIANVLAPGVGDAPLFPVTTRILNELVGEQHNNAWTCPDGSRIIEHPRGWLEYEP